jgi:ribosomal protein S12 methylthiotransferase
MSSSSPRSTDRTARVHRFHLESLGCAKNQVDSELMIAALERAGWERAEGPETADLLIVNTCGFISSARKESIETTLELKARHPGRRLIMAGCLTQRYADDLSKELPEIDGFLGAGDPAGIVALANALDDVSVPAGGPATEPEELARPYERKHLLSFPGSAYVKVAEGCDNRCTYCAIPLIRGDLASRDDPSIIAEVRGLLERGIREIILIAQDLGSYGRDRGAPALPRLLEGLAGIPGDFWVRLLYIHPDHFPRDMLILQQHDPRLLPYYDIPFQHASPRILKAMGRRSDPQRGLDLLAEIRSRVPGAVIRSTFLTGFPGETDQDFDQLLDFQARARLDWLGVFTYSREEDTPAYDMPGRVKKAVAEARKAQLELRQVPITEASLDARIGQAVDVLVEERVQGEDLSIGRAYLQAPDVDGLVVLRASRAPGSRVRARVIKRNGVDLEADVVE